MTLNLSEVLRSQDITNVPWWTGRIRLIDSNEDGEVIKLHPPHVYVLPVDDIKDHFSGHCDCEPKREFTGEGFTCIVIHNAFDGRT